MSFSRSKYDSCQYSADVNRSMSPMFYTTAPYHSTNNEQCFMLGGVVGGPTVKYPRQNIVDVESDLWGLSRNYSKCPTHKYMPKPKSVVNQHGPIGDGQPLSTNLNTCYFVQHKRPSTNGIHMS